MNRETFAQLMGMKEPRNMSQFADPELVRLAKEWLAISIQVMFDEDGTDKDAEAERSKRRHALADEIGERADAIAAENNGAISNTNLNILEAIQGTLQVHNHFYDQQNGTWFADSIGKMGSLIDREAKMVIASPMEMMMKAMGEGNPFQKLTDEDSPIEPQHLDS